MKNQMDQSNNEYLKNLSEKYFCLEPSPLQAKLFTSSVVYLIFGGIISSFGFVVNTIAIVYFLKSKKAKHSPICIYIFFLALFNLIKLSDFYISSLIKLKIINVEKEKISLLTQTEISHSNDTVCKWMNFLSNYSGHIGVYLTLLIQFQYYLAFKRNSSVSLLQVNYALTYLICFALIFAFFVADEFYLYENYFATIIYCPLTMIYNCVLNDEFKLLNKYKFDTMLYHHFHTLVYNILPLALIVIMNIQIIFEMRVAKDCVIKKDSLSEEPFVLNKNEKVQTRKKQNIHEDSISIKCSDVTYLSVIISFIQILNSIPRNFLSYLSEWDSEFAESLINFNQTFNNLRKDEQNINNYTTHGEIFFFYILFGSFEMFNFSFLLVFQFINCESLSKEFKKIIFRHKY
jgi:hypothetical protein